MKRNLILAAAFAAPLLSACGGGSDNPPPLVEDRLCPASLDYNTVYTGANNSTLDKTDSTQYIFIYDVSGANKANPKLVQAIHQNNAFDGLEPPIRTSPFLQAGFAESLVKYR